MTPIQKKEKIDSSSLPWTHWLLRYVATDNEQAFTDLIWSVGGSPPYGEVSYEEAEAVYELLEEYGESGEASEGAYKKVRNLIGHLPDRLSALELFHIRDHIASSPENLSVQDVEKGVELSVQLCHQGAQAYFTLLRAEIKYREGEIPEAVRYNYEGLSAFKELALIDPVYAGQLLNASKNSVSFAAMNGDFTLARNVITQMEHFGAGEVLAELRDMLGPSPIFYKSLSKVLDQASNYLENGDPVHALEWYAEAERIAHANKDETTLCGLLGDKAVAFRRIGNNRRAIETNREAISLSRKHGDYLNLSRWNGNLGSLLLGAGQEKEASECFSEAMIASIQTGRSDQISIAVGNLARCLSATGRYEEAIQKMDEARQKAGDDPLLNDLTRRNTWVILSDWAKALQSEGQLKEAIRKLEQAIELIDDIQQEEKLSKAEMLTYLGDLYERQNDYKACVRTLRQASQSYRDLGDHKRGVEIEKVIYKYGR